MEYSLREFFGYQSKWDGTAGGFGSAKYVREALLAIVKRIRKRLEEVITTDDRLLITTHMTLDALENSAKALQDNQWSLLEIVAHLLHLIAYLLGYDWLEGKPNRHIIYYQTADQTWNDDVAQHPETRQFKAQNKEDIKRYEIVNTLFDEKFRIAEIARVMKLSEPLVKDMLISSGKVKGRKTEFEEEANSE